MSALAGTVNLWTRIRVPCLRRKWRCNKLVTRIEQNHCRSNLGASRLVKLHPNQDNFTNCRIIDQLFVNGILGAVCGFKALVARRAPRQLDIGWLPHDHDTELLAGWDLVCYLGGSAIWPPGATVLSNSTAFIRRLAPCPSWQIRHTSAQSSPLMLIGQ